MKLLHNTVRTSWWSESNNTKWLSKQRAAAGLMVVTSRTTKKRSSWVSGTSVKIPCRLVYFLQSFQCFHVYITEAATCQTVVDSGLC